MPKRVDANQAEIVKGLRTIGATVLHLHTVGKGCPDICVGYKGTNYLFELKDPTKPPSARKLTPDEEKFHDEWKGAVHVVETFVGAYEIMTRQGVT